MSHTLASDNTGYYQTTIYCGTCNAVVIYPHYHLSEWYVTQSSTGNTQPTPEEKPVPDNIDNTLMDKLTAMRDTRDAAARYAQSKNDEASLHEIEAIRLRTQASMMYREINEGVPMTPDKK